MQFVQFAIMFSRWYDKISIRSSGTEVLVLDSKGKARRAIVGRSKIERRPMLMIKAKIGSEVGGIFSTRCRDDTLCASWGANLFQ